MPRGIERILTYVRERDAQGRLVIRAIPASDLAKDVEGPAAPKLEPVGGA
jgi:hypothetical protein